MSTEPVLPPVPTLSRHELAPLVRKEQVRLAIEQVRRMPLLHLLVDIGSTIVAWRAGAGRIALVWLLAITICQVGRSAYLSHLYRAGTTSTTRMLSLLAVSMAVQGAVHSLIIVIVFMQPDITSQYVVSTIMLGVAAGAIAPAAGHLPSYLYWAVVFWCTLGGAWLYQGTMEGTVLAALLATLFTLFALYVRDQGRTLTTLVGLTESLRRERDRSESERQRAEAERQRAQAANEARTRFFAAASHDLRQPLHALGINATTVQILAQQSGNAALGQVSEVIRRALQECRGLLDSLLEISELDAGSVKPDPQTVLIPQLLARIHDDCVGLAKEKGLLLQLQDTDALSSTLAASTDAALLARMVKNLVGNAIKFTPSGWVTLSATATGAAAGAGDSAGHVVVRIADSGPGIPAHEQEKIFEEFYQVGNSERDRSRGLGLGLAIVRRLGQLIGAEVSLHSEPGHGATFEIHLPRVALPAVAATPPTPREAGTASPDVVRVKPVWRVLVIDDEKEVRESLQTFLSVMGLRVRVANGGRQASALIDAGWHPDILVLDFRLRDGISGLDVLRNLRTQGCHAPAILVTGDTAPERIKAAQSAGLPLLYKPVDGLQLIDCMEEVLEAVTSDAQRQQARPARP